MQMKWPRVFAIALMLSMFLGGSASAESWKFGVISDTQWTIADDGKIRTPAPPTSSGK